MLQPILRLVFNVQDLSAFAPDLTIAFIPPNQIFLMVDAAEDDVPTDTRDEDGQGLDVGESNGVSSEVLRLKRVHGGKPDGRTPCKVETEMFVTDIDGTEVPIFVDEEIDHVDTMQNGGD
jgi:hypothetical protein